MFITPSMLWLWERKIFLMLRKIKTFSMFRKWRTFKCLAMNVRQAKNERCKYVNCSIKLYKKSRVFFLRKFLTRRLFSANEIFQSVLLHVRMLCERGSGSRNGLGIGDYNIIMIKHDAFETMTLQDFCNKQNKQIDYALSQLIKLKEEIMNLAYDSCLVVIDYII